MPVKVAGLATSVLFAIAAIVLVMVVPDRAQWVLYIASNGANEVVFPIGYWLTAGLWVFLSTRVVDGPSRLVAARAAGVAIVLHVLLLLALFSARLDEPELFSASFYWQYARLFCGAALALATWWAIAAGRAIGTGAGGLSLIDAPVIAGASILAVAVASHDLPVAVAGLVSGLFMSTALRTGAATLVAVRQPVRDALGNERLFLFAVFVLALGLRILYLRRVMTEPNYLETGADGPVYDELAWSIARGEGVRESFTNRFPLLLLGYVWLASGVYAIAGHSYFILGALQSMVGALACVLLYAVSKDLYGVVIARVATVFAAISYPLLFAAAAIGHQAIDVFLTLLVVWLLMRALRTMRTSLATWLGIGIAFGATIAVRETGAFFLLFVLVWIPFAFKRLAWTGAFRAASAMMLGVGVVLAPLVYPMVATAEKRLALRVHFDRLYVGEMEPDAIRTQIVGPLSAPRGAAAQLLTDPGLVLGTLGRAYARNIGLQFFSQPYGGFDLVFLSKGSEFYYGLWSYTYLLAAAGMVAALRGVRGPGAQATGLALVLGVIVSRTLPHVVLESNYRHRVPIEPFLILLTAAATVSLVMAARAQRDLQNEAA